jgi:hypothetical protein
VKNEEQERATQVWWGANTPHFDDDGVAHEAIEMKTVEEIFSAGDAKNVALEAGRKFGEKERLRSIKRTRPRQGKNGGRRKRNETRQRVP